MSHFQSKRYNYYKSCKVKNFVSNKQKMNIFLFVTLGLAIFFGRRIFFTFLPFAFLQDSSMDCCRVATVLTLAVLLLAISICQMTLYFMGKFTSMNLHGTHSQLGVSILALFSNSTILFLYVGMKPPRHRLVIMLFAVDMILGKQASIGQ